MSDDPQFQGMLSDFSAGADTVAFTVPAPKVTQAAPPIMRRALDGLWTEAMRQGELLAAAEREGFEDLPDGIVLESVFGPIQTPGGSIIVKLALTIEDHGSNEEEA